MMLTHHLNFQVISYYFTFVHDIVKSDIEFLSKLDYSYIFQDDILSMKIGVES